MKIKKIKKLIVLGIVCCTLLTAAAFAAGDTNTAEKGKLSSPQNQAVPFSTYYKTGSLSIIRGSGKANIIVNTHAYQTVNHIYHDITVYVNGNWYSSDRYETWNNLKLETILNVPASSGDYIDVYADHYTDHNGVVEGGHSHKAITY